MSLVGADQEEVDGLLSVAEDLTAGGVDGRQGRDGVDEEVRVHCGCRGLRGNGGSGGLG